ncbi:LytR/AlgR family response regulator transcription factor [Chondrinema litorale]|uniref:LytR/AlgR family response regulator transcription factor n=1 Tax=Chondrinema litorale TaxID=2994555 RepID=UPI00254303AB|nr:response regulator [Chondrinema litorale]UZR98482.1 response regulator [Chondrinema litorale]
MLTPKILIVEDEPIIAQDLKECLIDQDYEVINIAKSYIEAISYIEKEIPSIVLIDIILKGEQDGIEVAKYIRQTLNTAIIFITSHSDRAIVKRATALKPDGYLVKPFKEEDIYTSIETALSHYQTEKSSITSPIIEELKDFIFIRDKGKMIKLFHKDINWIKADGNYTEIHTISKKYVVRSILKDVSKQIPSKQFMRVHKSYIVNLSNVETIKNNKIIMSGNEIPIARSMYEQLVSKLNLLGH